MERIDLGTGFGLDRLHMGAEQGNEFIPLAFRSGEFGEDGDLGFGHGPDRRSVAASASNRDAIATGASGSWSVARFGHGF